MQFKFQKRFYIIAGFFSIIILYLLWGAMFGGNKEEVNTIQFPATIKNPPPFTNDQAKNKFIEDSKSVPSVDSFFKNFSSNKNSGLPATFISYVMPSDGNTPASKSAFTDKKYKYIPALFIDPNNPQTIQAINSQSGDDTNPQRPIMLAFPKETLIPSGGTFNRVYGKFYWISTAARSEAGLPEDPEGAYPIFLVYAFDQYQAIQAEFPSNITKLLDIDIIRNGYKLGVEQVEYNDEQTRVLISITNITNVTLEGWDAANNTKLNNGGSAPLSCGNLNNSEFDVNNDNNGALTSNQINPGTTLRGYVICSPATPSKDLDIQLPDLPEKNVSTSNNTNYINIHVPASSG